MPDTAFKGRVLWYELLTTDMKAAESFYTKVIGWGTQPFDGAGQPYQMWTRAGGTPIGGLMAKPADLHAPSHWVMYVGVPNLDESITRVERAGGKSLSPIIEVPNVGRMRVMLDPQGAAFAIYQPASPPPAPEAKPELGDGSWHELHTGDAAAAMSFYTDLFGWRESQVFDMGPMGKYRIFARSFDLGGMMNKMPEMAQVPPHWSLYFRVPDVNAAADRIKAGGGKILNGPMEVPGGDWIVNAMDPQGAAFSVHHLKK